ncbi:uncharacterized protein Z518_06611 [Rhinocladiella mackenziei CBS 650.93]|uniref:Rhinocladiella mackenziei CBS 650.93 unplaced genomic scaffold supercont1.5, whole genome shotgun sequence n=1 Tax=Rhinocladiella mackenziei CBS 650.93 TaxID=1442369 RepID=A0A0D2IIF0_9EURO|nr:uncharacterized protein Z518_06611 [Rhinocladiella mackenziei CBS 650.93]KIX03061.1 hypothetical protein Z518_06611 [Rhinocladiella mackenziei CBS 650.93]
MDMSHGVSHEAGPYSELEVLSSEKTVHPAPQLHVEPNCQASAEQDGAHKQGREYAHENSALIVIPAEDLPDAKYAAATYLKPVTVYHGRWKRKKWIILFVVALIAMGAIVGGVAGGLLSEHSGAKDTSASPSSSPPVSTATAPPAMSGTATSLASYGYPTAVSWGYPHMEIFALNSSMYPEWKYRPQNSTTNSENGGWQPASNSVEPFIQLDNKTAADEFGVSAITRSPTDVDIFITGADQQLWQKYHNTMTNWPADWVLLAGSHLSPPTAVSWAPDRLDIFTINSDHVLSQKWYTSASGWEPYYTFSSQFSFKTYAPTVVSWAEDRYDIFLVGSEDQSLYHKYYDGESWEPIDFEKLGGFCTSRPVAVCRQKGKTDIFVRGGDAGLWHMSFSQDVPTPQQWSNWTSLSGRTAMQAEPEAVSSDSNTLHVFVWGADNALLYKSYDARTNSWTPSSGFHTLGDSLSGPPKAVFDGQSVHVFAYLKGGQLGHKSLDIASNAWNPVQQFELLGSV